MLMGAFIQTFSYFAKLYTNKEIYKLSTSFEEFSQYKDVFQQYADINIPSFIENLVTSDIGVISAYLVQSIGFIICAFLFSIPSKQIIKSHKKEMFYIITLFSLIILIYFILFFYINSKLLMK